MNFDFDDTQYALRDLARELFTRESPPSRLRGLMDGRSLDRSVWKTMAAAGITGVTVPEGYGGAGGNELDLALVYEEAGRAALPEPLLDTVGIAAPIIATYGTHKQRERWLPAIASGDAIIAVDSSAYAYEADATLSIGDDVRLDGESIGDVHVAAYQRAFFGTASLLNGVAMQLLQTTLAYVKDRRQFGKPVGSFQAVKHKLASMHVAIETSRPATWFAAYAVANDLDGASVDACVAKIAANDAEELCNGESLQCHGGIGFTWEHDLHFWLKRGIALRSSFGSSLALRRQLLKVHTIEELI